MLVIWFQWGLWWLISHDRNGSRERICCNLYCAAGKAWVFFPLVKLWLKNPPDSCQSVWSWGNSWCVKKECLGTVEVKWPAAALWVSALYWGLGRCLSKLGMIQNRRTRPSKELPLRTPHCWISVCDADSLNSGLFLKSFCPHVVVFISSAEHKRYCLCFLSVQWKSLGFSDVLIFIVWTKKQKTKTQTVLYLLLCSAEGSSHTGSEHHESEEHLWVKYCNFVNLMKKSPYFFVFTCFRRLKNQSFSHWLCCVWQLEKLSEDHVTVVCCYWLKQALFVAF